MTKTVESGVFFREAQIQVERAEGDQGSRVISATFSTETPCPEFVGGRRISLILDHGPGSIRMDRFASRGKVLLDHNRSKLLGAVQNPHIVNRQLVGEMLHSENELAQNVLRDVRSVPPIRTDVSLGFRVYKIKLEGETDKGVPIARSYDWEPMEVSHVSIGADAGAVILHADGGKNSIEIEGYDMGNATENSTPTIPQDQTSAPVQIDINAEREKVRLDEIDRIRSINAIGEAHNVGELASKFVNSGEPVDAFRTAVLDQLATDPGEPNVQYSSAQSSFVDISEKESQRYDLGRAIRAIAFPDQPRYRQEAGFELEMSEEAQRISKMEARGIAIPPNFLTRTGQAGTATKGAELIQTSVLGGRFIDLLRNRMVTTQFTPLSLSGLQGNIAIPKQTGAGTAYWVAEGSQVTKSGLTTGQVLLSPKNLMGEQHYSKQLLTQSSVDVNAMYERDIASILALEWDRASLYGTGSNNQPTGVQNQTGVTKGADYTAPGPTFPNLVALETAVSASNADVGQLGYLMASGGRGHCKQTVKFANTGMTIWEPGNQVNGYNTGVSNQVTSTHYWYGNWGDLILAQWGIIDLTADPYTRASWGEVRLIALMMVDVGIRRAESFTYIDQAA